jgi:polar amino acid transport system substrate-binding protein
MISCRKKVIIRNCAIAFFGLFIASILFGSDLSAAAENKLYLLSTSTGAPYATEDRDGFQDLIVAEVFQRIGLKAQIVQYDASARALANANENIDHGVAMRIKGLEKRFTNLVRVDERIIENDFVAYSKNLDFSIDGWKSLLPYTSAYINGWVIFERNLDPAQNKHAVKDPDQMFKMLDKNRIDLVLYERWQGLQRAKQAAIQVKVLEPPLASVDMFMYVHKEHAHLAPKMAQALREMKADGTYRRIFDRTLNSLLSAN